MNREEFIRIIDENNQKVLQLQATKGKDYAGDDDVLSNFDRHGTQLGVGAELVWAVYAGKHWDAIQSYCKEPDRNTSEPIEGRLTDLIVYCYLMLAMVQDRKRIGSHAQMHADIDNANGDD